MNKIELIQKAYQHLHFLRNTLWATQKSKEELFQKLTEIEEMIFPFAIGNRSTQSLDKKIIEDCLKINKEAPIKELNSLIIQLGLINKTEQNNNPQKNTLKLNDIFSNGKLRFCIESGDYFFYLCTLKTSLSELKNTDELVEYESMKLDGFILERKITPINTSEVSAEYRVATLKPAKAQDSSFQLIPDPELTVNGT